MHTLSGVLVMEAYPRAINQARATGPVWQMHALAANGEPRAGHPQPPRPAA